MYNVSSQYFMPVPDQIRDPGRIPNGDIISPPKPEKIIPDEEDGDGMEYPPIIKKDDKKKRPWDTPLHIMNIDKTLK